jgi:hypothetical protein
MRPFRVGINELQVPRLLLDTCTNVEEAQIALRLNKQYHVMLSCHYIVADRYGNSFVWEHSQGHNLEHIIESAGKPQVVTNHPLHRTPAHSAPDVRSEDREACWRGDSYQRYQTLSRAIEAHPDKYSVDFLKETNACVFFDDVVEREYTNLTSTELLTTGRTLWHSVYDTEERSLEVSFYLRDEPGAEETDPRMAIRSDYHRFQLSAM